jgi:mRNA-degrading endonuclease RelE of RelBE toxin-antitoxin system
MSEIVATNTFKRGYKSLSAEFKQRVDDAIKLMAATEDPRILGLRKKGQLANLFAYEIGQHIRILFSVEGERVILHRVGSHAEVYH